MIDLKQQRGSMLLELALILPLLLTVLVAIIQFGFILNAKIAVNSAAYEAARAATMDDDPQGAALAAVENYPGSALPGWNFNDRLGASIELESHDPGYPVKVAVKYRVPIFFPKIFSFPNIDNGNFVVSGFSIMGIEEKE
ncbi:MAG: TadE/TadG family type IV pilus assembly protein [Actinomycetota bacterium]